MRYLLLLFLLSYLPALAQSELPSAVPDFSPAPTTGALPDTAAAIQRLFAQKRRFGVRLGTAAIAAGAVLAYGATQATGIGTFVLLGEASGATAGVGLFELLAFGRGYSRRREQQAIAAWQAHQLPPHLKKKLTSRYFQPTP